MSKTKSIFLIFVSVVAITGFGLSVYAVVSMPKVRYVDNIKLLREYQGYQDNLEIFESSRKRSQANIDTLGSNYNYEAQKYSKNRDKLTRKEQELTEKLLTSKKRELINFSKATEESMKRKEAELSEETLTAINDFMTHYGERENLDLVVGNTADASILYRKELIDITDEILIELNKKYKEEK